MVTIEDLKKELSERDYRMLTDGDDAVAERALAKARVWVTARFKKCGKEVDYEDELIKEAILKRALYELYSFAENEKVAADKKEDAEDLLEGVLGDCADSQEKYRPVAAKVAAGEPTPLAKDYKNFMES